jgi:hypothetical protein
MSIQEIKEQLHLLVNDSENSELLERIVKILKREDGGRHTLDDLTPKQRERLEKSVAQSMYPEQCIPHSIVKEEAAKWGKSK